MHPRIHINVQRPRQETQSPRERTLARFSLFTSPRICLEEKRARRFCSLARRTCDMPQRRWSEPVTARQQLGSRPWTRRGCTSCARGRAVTGRGGPRGPESRPLAVGSSHSCRVGPTALTRRRGLRLRLGRRRGAPPPRCPPAAVSSCPAEGLAAGSVAHPGHPPALLLPGDRVPVPGRSLRSHSASRPSCSIPAFPGPFPGAGV